MENASKALLIAAGIFLTVLLLSMAMVLYQNISTYYEDEHNRKVIEQTQKVNSQFENYNRKEIRGSDIISLMNKVIDYNASESYQDGTGFKRIKVTIKLGDENILKQFKFENDGKTSYVTTGSNNYLRKSQIDNTTGGGTNWSNDRELSAITGTSKNLIDMARKNLGLEITDTHLQQLASNISNLIVDESDTDSQSSISNRIYRQSLIEDIIGLKIKVEDKTAITKSEDKSKVKNIQEIASQYYQYMQFKRAYFDCVEIKYDSDTDRIESMIFEVQKKEGNVVFD